MNTTKPTWLVTGAGGFLGKALCRHLKGSVPVVRVVATGKGHPRGMSAWTACDLRKPLEVRRLLRKTNPQIVFHCAGTTRAEPWTRLWDANVLTAACLLEAAAGMARPPRIVLLSSAAEYGDVPRSRQPVRESEPARPATPYGMSKACQTSIGRWYARQGVPVVIARVFNIIGPGQPLHFSVARFARLIQRARPGSVIKVGSLEAVRDFVSLDDVCRALIALARRGRVGEVYNVATGFPVRMRQILEKMMAAAKVRVRVRSAKNSGSPRSEVAWSVGDPGKIRRHTGWRARVTWEEAVESSMKPEPGL